MLPAAHNYNEDCEEQVQRSIMRRVEMLLGGVLSVQWYNFSNILKTPSGLLS